MTWARKFAKPIALKDGRTIETLADARNFILFQSDQEQLFWHYAAELLIEAATNGDERAIDEARAQLTRALRAERLI
jgi:hypothetical protein